MAQKAFVSHNGVKLYRAFKDRREMDIFYALYPRQQCEDDNIIDIRRLPKRYRGNSKIHLDLSEAMAPASAGYLFDPEKVEILVNSNDELHREVLRRAINDGYDFSAAGRGNYSQFVRRLKRWLK